MRLLGTLTAAHMNELARRGIGEEQAFHYALQEARLRYPLVGPIHVVRGPAGSFMIISGVDVRPDGRAP